MMIRMTVRMTVEADAWPSDQEVADAWEYLLSDCPDVSDLEILQVEEV